MNTVYFSNGVPSIDPDDVNTPTQGLTVAAFTKTAGGEWTIVQRGPDGKPYFGYKAKQLTDDEADLWKTRIAQAAVSGPNGYKDEGGVWYPGRIGAGRSVIDSVGYALLQKNIKKETKQRDTAQLAELQPAYTLAKTINAEDPLAVLKAFRPDIPAELLAKLHKNNTVV